MKEMLLWFAIAAVAILGIITAVSLTALRRRVMQEQKEAEEQREKLKHERAYRNDIEDELRLRQELYSALFNNTQDMIFIHGLSAESLPGKFTEVNAVACARLGYSRDEMKEMTVLDIEEIHVPTTMPNVSRSQLAAMSEDEFSQHGKRLATHEARSLMARILDDGDFAYEKTFISRSGERIPVEIRAHRFTVFGKPMILCAAHDVTERLQAQQALHDSERRFADFFRNSPTGVALYGPDRQLVDVNRTCLRMFGAPEKEEFAKFDMFSNDYLPDAARRAIRKGETVRFEAGIDFSALRANGAYACSKLGIAWFDILITNLGLDTQYSPKGYLVEVQDVTKRHAAEAALKESEKQLQQARKLEALGTLAGGIAHDFNNMLTPILGYSEIAIRMLTEDNPVREYMEEIVRASNRAKDLIDQIMTFSRRKEADEEPMRIRVVSVLKEVLKLISASLPETVTVQRVIKAERDAVMANPTQLHQVFMNLFTNAEHAMRSTGGGVLEVRASDLTITERGARDMPGLAAGSYLLLSIGDTGCGMTREVMDRIFEPFFTTKKRGEGTGMGLAVVHGIVAGLGGLITVESEVGKGTTFHIALPTVDNIDDRVITREAALAAPVEHIAVLMVDDEQEITTLGARMLETLGYEAFVSTSAYEALQQVTDAPDRFRVVLTDQVMPEMSGAELARKIRAINPRLPIVCVSGFAEAFTQEQIDAMGFNDFVRKPIALNELSQTIQKAVRAADAAPPPA